MENYMNSLTSEVIPWANSTMIMLLTLSKSYAVEKADTHFIYYKDTHYFTDMPDPARSICTKAEFELYTSLMLWNTDKQLWEKAI
jgi:hypothetical protein